MSASSGGGAGKRRLFRICEKHCMSARNRNEALHAGMILRRP